MLNCAIHLAIYKEGRWASVQEQPRQLAAAPAMAARGRQVRLGATMAVGEAW